MNIDRCNDLPKKEKIKLAEKYGISPEDIRNSSNLCNLIKNKYKKKYPCNNIIEKDTDLTIKKHQLNVSNHLVKSRGVIVYHQVGTGKTLTAITTAQCLLLSNIVKKVIVITPTSLQENFKQSLIQYNPDIDISKYHLYTIQKLANDIENKNVISCTNALLIIDEAHNLRTLEGSRFKSIYNYSLKAEKILLLTATPFINYKYDIINLVSLIRKEPPITKDEFYKIERNKTELKEYLKDTFSLYFKTNEDDPNFPSKEVISVYLEMPPEYLKIYNKLEQGEADKVPMFKDKNIQVFYNGVRRASNNINNLSPKNNWILQKILDNKKSKFLIFSHFLEMGIMSVMKLLDKEDIKYLSVTGDMSINDRKYAVDKYNNDEVNILFISKAGSEGLDLKNTTYIILMDPSWNENEIEQIIGRGVRYKSHHTLKKSKRKVIIYKLYCIKPIEYKNLETIINNNLFEYDDNVLSIDLYLKNFSKLKQQDIDLFFNIIQKWKII